MKNAKILISLLIASMLIAVGVATYGQMSTHDLGNGVTNWRYSCPDAEWVGNPAVKGGDRYNPHLGWLPDYEIGFCPNGLVVWRKMEKR